MNFLDRGRWAMALLACCLTGCVIVPYKPAAEVVETQDVALDPANIMVTIGPRQLVEEVIEAIGDEDRNIRVVPTVDFLNVAIPGDDLTLQGLLTSGSAQHAREHFGTDYLVLVGEKKEYTTDEFGGMVPYMGFYGLYKGSEHTTLLSTIIDLEHARPLSDVSAHAQGTTAGAGAFYGLFIVPMTGSSARDGMARGIVASLRHAAGSGPLTIAVAAGERIVKDEEGQDAQAGESPAATAPAGEVSPRPPEADEVAPGEPPGPG